MENQVLLYQNTIKLPDVFNQEHIKKMLQTLEDSQDYPDNDFGRWEKCRDKSLLMTMFNLALRPKEACKLKFEDFNFFEATVKICGINNKTRKDRVIPIPKDLIPFYHEYFSFDRAYFWKGSPYLFPSAQNEFLSPSSWKRIMRDKILKPAGIYHVGKTRSYTLRHTRATEILNKSKDLFLVSNLLGHSKLDSTKVYLHKNPTYMNYMRSMLDS